MQILGPVWEINRTTIKATIRRVHNIAIGKPIGNLNCHRGRVNGADAKEYPFIYFTNGCDHARNLQIEQELPCPLQNLSFFASLMAGG